VTVPSGQHDPTSIPIAGSPRPSRDGTDLSTIVDVLRARAAARPERLAYTMLDEEREHEPLTYGALDRRAQAVAAALGDAEPGVRVLLLVPSSVDFLSAFFGCLYRGLVAVPAPGPEGSQGKRAMPRLRAILRDAGADVVVTGEPNAGVVAKLIGQLPELARLRHVVVGDLAAGSCDPAPARPEQIAYLQYTSGSTAAPKGVVITHDNLLHQCRLIHRAWDYDAQSVSVNWMPHFHDYGLVEGLIQPLYAGIPSYLLTPFGFLKRPLSWLRAIARYGATHSAGPAFAYDYCVRNTADDERRGLDLRCWRTATLGAERIRPDTMRLFAEAFEPYGFRRDAFYPGYGLAEFTLMVTTKPRGRAPTVASREHVGAGPPIVGCGRPVGDTRVAIVDPDSGKEVAGAAEGEVWVAGRSRALGYWKRPGETRATFEARLAGDGKTEYLRTGDRGFLRDGELFISGRLKDVVIVRGANHHAEDIEHALADAMPALRGCRGAAFAVSDDGEERLVVVHEIEARELQPAEPDELGRTAQRVLAEYADIQLHALALVPTGRIPRTTSGKVQRGACREQWLRGELRLVGAWTAGAADPQITPGAGEPPVRCARRRDELRRWLMRRIGTARGLPASAVDPAEPFAAYGLTSAEAVRIAGELEKRLGERLPASLFYDHPSIDRVVSHLADGDLVALPRRAGPDGGAAAPDEPVAIVGIGCRLPGGIDAPASFWRALCDGIDAVGEIPRSRWDATQVYDPDPDAPGKMVSRWGAFFDRVDEFDPGFFGISPREAAQMDPQQRLLLEVTQQALDDAGLPREDLAGSDTGVFVGISESEYAWLNHTSPELANRYTATGAFVAIAANRISYVYDLHGPSFTVDAVCSSSLLALHLACQSLARGECSLALVGGVNLLLTPDMYVWFSKLGVLSPDGRCRAFDAGANGIVFGEGAVTLVLAPLSVAQARDDRIRALVHGSAVAQDGRTNGLTAPSQHGQEALLRAAYHRAGVAPGRVDYVEAHGTGTGVGDPVEARALGAVLGEGRPAGRLCRLGSVKTNFGHLGTVGGLAGVAKVALALEHRVLPPSLHFRQSDPQLPLAELGLDVQTELGDWPSEAAGVAGVTSLSFGGTNVHVVLGEAPPGEHVAHAAPGEDLLLPISARDPDALRAVVEEYARIVERKDAPPLADLCYSSAVRRGHHDSRMTALASSTDELLARLRSFLRGEGGALASAPGRRTEAPRVAFVFSGQGSMWTGMGHALLARSATYRDELGRCDELMRDRLGWSPLKLIASRAAIDQGRQEQPVVFAHQVALAATWQALGVEPCAIVGHSVGEIAAAHVAGVLSLEDAVSVVCARAEVWQPVRGRGGMVLVQLGADDVRAALGERSEVAVAAVNSHRSTVVSGATAPLEDAVGRLTARGAACQPINVDVPSHSPLMDEAGRELADAVSAIRPGRGSVPIYSTVTGGLLAGDRMDAGHWRRNLTRPVQFAGALRALAADGADLYLEIAPHPLLLPSIEEELRNAARAGIVLPSTRRDEEVATWLYALAQLYVSGAAVRWTELYPRGRLVATPAHPFRRRSLWLDAPGSAGAVAPATAPRPAPVATAREVHLGSPAWKPLTDHRVGDGACIPAAAYVSLAAAAAQDVLGPLPLVLEHVALHEPCAIAGDGAVTLRVDVRPTGRGQARFTITSTDGRRNGTGGQHHAEGSVRAGGDADGASTRLDALPPQHADELPAHEHRRLMEQHGARYGPAFHGVVEVRRRPGEAWARVRVERRDPGRDDGALLDALVLDACLQVAYHLRPPRDGSVLVPATMRRLRWLRPLAAEEYWVRARPDAREPGTFSASIAVCTASSEPVVEIDGLELRTWPSARRPPAAIYTPAWQPAPPAGPADPAGGLWVVLAGGGGVGERVANGFRARGQRCASVRPAARFERLAGESFAVPPSKRGFARLAQALEEHAALRGIVDLRPLDESLPKGGEGDPEAAVALCARLADLVGGWSDERRLPRLWVVTRGAHATAVGQPWGSPAMAALAAVAGVARLEHPETRCSLIDLDPRSGDDEHAAILDAVLAGRDEPQIAIRGAELRVRALVRGEPASAACVEPPLGRGAAWRLAQRSPGVLDAFALEPAAARRPGPGEVRLAVHAAGLGFRDVLKALGAYPVRDDRADRFGDGCAGTVTAVGDGVVGVREGEEVIAVGDGCLASSLTTPAALVAPKPSWLSFDEAAAAAVPFLTAYRALVDLARLEPGELALVHSAASGVGLAALQLARWRGAEVLATAGTPEKRDYLRSLGVGCVMDSRSLSFIEETLEHTGGRGVDVVLNSLAGEAIPGGLGALAPYGRFVELGRRDIERDVPLALAPFRNDLAFFSLGLARLFGERPLVVQRLLAALVRLFEERALTPLPTTRFAAGDAEPAFRLMARAAHIGAIAICPTPSGSDTATCFRPDATYLVTGGLGVLGLQVARRMLERGAGRVALLGRTPPTPERAPALAQLRSLGGDRVAVHYGDVTDLARMRELLAELDGAGPPLRGIVHAAAVLDDALLTRTTPARLRAVMAPKTVGAWNLHVLTAGRELDLFVMFSSVASLLGSPGQAGYAAANAFLDALAHHRRRSGLPALSINWGPWEQMGSAAAARGAEHWELRGVGAISPAEGLDALEELLARDVVQAAVARCDPDAGPDPRDAAAAVAANGHGPSSADELEEWIRDEAGALLRMDGTQIDDADSFRDLGFDSLMSLELRNRLEAALDVELPATLVWRYANVRDLAAHLATRLATVDDESTVC
jgi:phthiocerol/phenolphthiocerol synthesis type-I polyketide synthase C